MSYDGWPLLTHSMTDEEGDDYWEEEEDHREEDEEFEAAVAEWTETHSDEEEIA